MYLPVLQPVISMKPRMSVGATDVYGKPKISQTLPNSSSFGQGTYIMFNKLIFTRQSHFRH